jgi:D-alanyl-D-alanine carboxypeptidase (penicillin-binding protein 5/6)
MTKVMTAYLVARLAESSPEILDEVVTFSRRADDTIGSTAGVRTGESLPVRELLYGLLLPSGNDASVALAEHFGHRLRPGGNGDSRPAESDPYEDFVAGMNAVAGQLGMEHAHFKNTHGLTETGHECSPRDMLKLAYAAMQSTLFRETVRTSVHGCQLEGPGGYRRNVRWKNTNRLLNIEGFDGIKTGTTSAAGACLASRGTRGEHTLLVVVMGAASSDSRYADSRNLYRWAWQQLEEQGN